MVLLVMSAPPSTQSLVKYDNPVLVGGAKGKGKAKAASGAPGAKALPPVDGKQLTQTEDILNSILPPRFVSAAGPVPLLHPASCVRHYRATGLCGLRWPSVRAAPWLPAVGVGGVLSVWGCD